MASGEIGGTLPGTAALMSLLEQHDMIPQDNSIFESIKDLLVGNGQSVFEVLIVLQNFIDMIGEGLLFRIEDCMDNGLRMHKDKYIKRYILFILYHVA